MQQHNPVPKSLKDFWLYYFRIDPARWILFMCQDLVHFTRYQVAFVLIGIGVDSLVDAVPGQGIPTKAWLVVVAMFCVLGFAESLHVWTAYIVRRWKPALRKRIRKDFFRYVMEHSHGYFQDQFAGTIARRVTEIAESSCRLHDALRFNILGSIVMMSGAMVGMLIISPAYAIILLIFLISVIAPILFRLKRISGRARDFSEVRSKATGAIVDILTNSSTMRNFSRFEHESVIHDNVSAEEAKSDERRILTLIQIEHYRRGSFVLVATTMMGALLYGWNNGIVSIGDVSAIMGLSLSLTGTIWFFGMGVIMTADELGYIDDAIRSLTTPHDIVDKDNAKDLNISKAQVSFKNVNFDYPEQPIFTNFSLDIEPGQKVGVLGVSGAGKSTLISLLLRFYDIQEGSITIDGQNIAEVTQRSLRESIAVIPQDTSLFHRSLIDNIRYGQTEASDEEVIKAAKHANAHEFISSMPDGYNTMVGERGVKLSGGQRQRIAVARAILKDAPILILDEATSALDSESEKYIQDSLLELMKGKTVVAIAHRLSTIAHLDRLLVMENGKIIEDGSHEELLAQDGYYARLWSMQSGGFLAAA